MLTPEQRSYVENIKLNYPNTDVNTLIQTLHNANWSEQMIQEALQMMYPRNSSVSKLRVATFIVLLIIVSILVSTFFYFNYSKLSANSQEVKFEVENGTLVCGGVVIDVSDPLSFEIINHFYAKDKAFYYSRPKDNCPGLASVISANIAPCGCQITRLFPVSDFIASIDEYTIQSTNGVYKFGRLTDADGLTFEVLKTQDGMVSTYGKDKQAVYWENSKIEEADLETFEALERDTGKDINYVYAGPHPWKPDNISKISVMRDLSGESSKYLTDGSVIYFNDIYKDFKGVSNDTENFAVILSYPGGVAKDSEYVFLKGQSVGDIINYPNLSPLLDSTGNSTSYLVSDNSIYNVTFENLEKIPEVTATNFRALINQIGTDGKNIYVDNKKISVPFDIAKMKQIPNEKGETSEYVQVGNDIYFISASTYEVRRLSDVDLQSFVVTSRNIMQYPSPNKAKDKFNHYISAEIVPESEWVKY